jgi:hypothetical protein
MFKKRKRKAQAQAQAEARQSDMDIVTGPIESKLLIVGRPRSGQTDKFVLLEEAGEPVQMHWMRAGRTHLPHFKVNCRNCQDGDDCKAFHYVGCWHLGLDAPAIAELTEACFASAQAGAVERPGPGGALVLRGLLCTVFRGSASYAARVLRVQQRVLRAAPWQYCTRRELARIWGVPAKPRIYREA